MAESSLAIANSVGKCWHWMLENILHEIKSSTWQEGVSFLFFFFDASNLGIKIIHV